MRGAAKTSKGTVKEPICIHCILAMVYFLAIPLTIATDSTGNSFLKIMTLPIGLFFLGSMFFYKDKLELNSVHACFALFLVSVISTLFVEHGGDSVNVAFGHCLNGALLFVVTMRRYNSREIEWLENTQLALLAVMVILAFTQTEQFNDADRSTISIFGSECDPNYFCGFFILPIAASLKRIMENKSLLLSAALGVLILLSAYVIMTTGSRGGIIGIAMLFASFAVLSARSVKNAVVMLLILAAAAVLFWNIVVPTLPESVQQRLTIESAVESHGNSRVDIWLSMLDTIRHSTWKLITGNGINAMHPMIINGEMANVVAHNQFVQTLYNQGVFGFSMFIALSAACVLRNVRKRYYISAALIGVLGLSMSLTLSTNIKLFWNLVMYAALYMPPLNKSALKGDEVRSDEKKGEKALARG